MNCVTPYCAPVTGSSGQEGIMEPSGFKSMGQQAMEASLSSSTDVSIRTREGDIVTIKSESFSEFEAFSYDRSGRISTENGIVAANVSVRTMTLASGSSFTFSVEGSLNDQELDDIESILASLDEIMNEMIEGDMNSAVEKALMMEGYDTVSQFTADLSMRRSYSVYTRTAQETSYDLPAGESRRNELSPLDRELEKMMERMAKVIEQIEEFHPKTIEKPVDQLFRHHLDKLRQHGNETSPVFRGLTDLHREIQERIQQMIRQASTDV